MSQFENNTCTVLPAFPADELSRIVGQADYTVHTGIITKSDH